VPLKSGGYLVINPTEALVSIDVNSGKSTRERNIERTAFRTNLEAAEEVARQLRLRDLAGLVVIDFIDMEESRNNRAVERKLKDSLKSDRARLQVGRISSFGLLEMSRQRLRPGLLESSTVVCPVCAGAGSIRSVESSALQIIRVIEEEGIKGRAHTIQVTVPLDVALYILNNKRHDLNAIEERFHIVVQISGDAGMHRPHYILRREGQQEAEHEPRVITQDNFLVAEDDEPEAVEEEEAAEDTAEAAHDDEEPRRGRRSRRGRGRDRQKADGQPSQAAEPGAEQPDVPEPVAEAAAEVETPEGGADGSDESRGKRRRGRRGGRRRRKQRQDETGQSAGEFEADETSEQDGDEQDDGESYAGDAPEIALAEPDEPAWMEPAPAEPEPVRHEWQPETVVEETIVEETAAETVAEPEPILEPEPVAAGGEPEQPKRPRRQGWWNRATGN
jgi:ribonuclease E